MTGNKRAPKEFILRRNVSHLFVSHAYQKKQKCRLKLGSIDSSTKMTALLKLTLGEMPKYKLGEKDRSILTSCIKDHLQEPYWIKERQAIQFNPAFKSKASLSRSDICLGKVVENCIEWEGQQYCLYSYTAFTHML